MYSRSAFCDLAVFNQHRPCERKSVNDTVYMRRSVASTARLRRHLLLCHDTTTLDISVLLTAFYNRPGHLTLYVQRPPLQPTLPMTPNRCQHSHLHRVFTYSADSLRCRRPCRRADLSCGSEQAVNIHRLVAVTEL